MTFKNLLGLVCGLFMVMTCSYLNAQVGQDEQDSLPLAPLIAAASDEGQEAIASFKFPENWQCTLFAAEPMVANPVAVDVDFKGRLFVCESFRQERGVEDNRSHNHWLLEDLAAQSVADRVAYMRRQFSDADTRFQDQDDRIRLLLDQDGDGIADKSTVFSDRYNDIAMGTGAGVLSYRDKVFYACIPDLFQLQDQDGDYRAEKRESLHTGFGVRFAFRGHDMHGLIVGPDGRLYFSIGDRGYNVSDEIKDPTSGAVFRCELDGSQLEVFATGLRNPQELAFDDFGNLFTGDNNSDSGDQARWVYVVPGGDTGWRMHYQYLPDRGPFNREKIWHPYSPDTPAYIIPPIDNLSDGPSGLAFYPGTGFGDHFKDRFFLCDFRGTAPISGIRTFRNEQVGAFWKVKDMEQTVWQTLATDVHFGPAGRLYVSDWVFGWVGENKGRIYTYHDPNRIQSKLVQQTAQLLNGAILSMPTDALVQLLAHPDRRVRQEAQFELAQKASLSVLGRVATSHESRLARVHALWAIGQMSRRSMLKKTDRLQTLLEDLLTDQDFEIRAQSAKLAGELRIAAVNSQLVTLLTDVNLRVRYFAAMALAHTGTSEHIAPVCRMLIENNDQDPIVRHGGIMFFKGLATRSKAETHPLAQLAAHPSVSVRVAACVAMRKTGSEIIKVFLDDVDLRVTVEAARAIYDTPIDGAMDALASTLAQPTSPDPLLRRAIGANLRLQSPQSALRLAQFAADEAAPTDRRLEALDILGNWANERPLDPVHGDWIGLQKGDSLDARRALNRHFEALTKGTETVRTKTIVTAGQLQLASAASMLRELVLNSSESDDVRATAFSSLVDMTQVDEALFSELTSKVSELPSALGDQVIGQLAIQSPSKALPILESSLLDPSVDFGQKRNMLNTLARMKDAPSQTFLAKLLAAATNQTFPAELRLDLVQTIRSRENAELAELIEQYIAKQSNPNDPKAEYVDALVGGNAANGKKIFYEKTEVSCVRCHKIDAVGGAVGPDLSSIGLQRNRAYLLESLVQPNATIAEGFAQSIVLTEDGLTYTGLVIEKTDSEWKMLDADGKTIVIPTETIEDTKTGKSSMPTDLMKHLSKSEVRDLIEYLAQRRKAIPSDSH